MALVVAPAVLPVGRTVTLHSLGGFKKGGVTVGSDGVAARVVGRLPQLAPNAPKVPCAVLLPEALSVRIERMSAVVAYTARKHPKWPK